MNWTLQNADGQQVSYAAGAVPTVYAPTNAPYVTVTPDANLSAEFALSTLAAGLLYNNPGSNPSIATLAQSQNDWTTLADQKASGTAGGASVTTTWTKRNINIMLYANSFVVGISSDQWTLASGVYRIRASAPAYETVNHQIRIYDVTNARVARDPAGYDVVGTSERCSVAADAVTRSFIDRALYANGQTTFELQHWVSAGKATNGFGVPVTSGAVETYSLIHLEKIA